VLLHIGQGLRRDPATGAVATTGTPESRERFSRREGRLSGISREFEKNDRYVVVEKFGESAVGAIKLDPGRRAR
jgi:hypothetical protein